MGGAASVKQGPGKTCGGTFVARQCGKTQGGLTPQRDAYKRPPCSRLVQHEPKCQWDTCGLAHHPAMHACLHALDPTVSPCRVTLLHRAALLPSSPAAQRSVAPPSLRARPDHTFGLPSTASVLSLCPVILIYHPASDTLPPPVGCLPHALAFVPTGLLSCPPPPSAAPRPSTTEDTPLLPLLRQRPLPALAS